MCYKCAKEENHYTCTCDEENRCLTGVFCSNELQKALELGYKVKEIYEILDYPKRRNDIFSPYINRWYKIKAETSGYPKGIVSEDQYIRDFERIEGIKLDKENIKSNPGLRSIAKLMLNSLWGKFAQRSNLPTTLICNNYGQMHNIITDPKYEVLGDEMINDMLSLNYKLINEEKKDKSEHKCCRRLFCDFLGAT